MPKDFKGHLDKDDPRHPLWGAGGADWPTIPPFRIRLGVVTTTRRWRVLRFDGVLFEAEPTSTHDDVTWLGRAPFPTDVTGMWLWRHFDKIAQKVWWFIFIDHDLHHQALQIEHVFEPGPANDVVFVENDDWPYGHIPDPGTPFELWQVYYDEELPPEGWPPWA